MLVACAKNLLRYARYPVRQLVRARTKFTPSLNSFRFLGHEIERHAHIRRNLDWMTYRAGTMETFTVETEGLKLGSSEKVKGDFSKIDQGHFCHALTAEEADVDFFSLEDVSESESIIMGGEAQRVLIPNRMVNMLGFINHKMEGNSPALSETLSTQ